MVRINLLRDSQRREKEHKNKRRKKVIILSAFVLGGTFLCALIWYVIYALTMESLMEDKKVKSIPIHQIPKPTIEIIVPVKMKFEDCYLIDKYIKEGNRVIIEQR